MAARIIGERALYLVVNDEHQNTWIRLHRGGARGTGEPASKGRGRLARRGCRRRGLSRRRAKTCEPRFMKSYRTEGR